MTNQGFEKIKVYRQYFGTSALPVDEARCLPYYQYRSYQKSFYPRRDRSMGNVYVHSRLNNFFLGYRYYPVTSSSLPQE